jgi:hypothetical protein
MLAFVTCVKHPENSRSYNKVWQLLNNTLYSVCSQTDTDFRVIVICDKKLPLLHHQELIEKYTDFIDVDFSAHSESVLKNFKELGNLSPPLEDIQWWQTETHHQTSLDVFGRNGPSFLMQLLDKTVGQKGIENLRKAKSAIKNFLQGNKSEKASKEREHYHIANVVLNMATKLLVGILAAKKHTPDYLMLFDADDYIGNDISAYVNSHPGQNGWIMAHGYRMAGKKIAPYYRWNSICGTGNIYNYALLLELIGNKVTETSTQNELFQHVDSEFLITIGQHTRSRSFFAKKGRTLLEYPTRSVIHLVDHNESSEFSRKIIRREQADVFLQNAKKFGEITPVFSTLIGYFNILPDNTTKVFCLGFQKTGTTSVDWVLQDMGYQVAKAYKQADAKFSKALKKKDISEIKQLTELFDAFQDIPWFLYYKEFDRWYSESKFILTTRESVSWWNSFLRYFRTEHYPLFEYVYGFDNPTGNKKALVERFEQHNNAVVEYFKDRPDDLLLVDVAEERALEKISQFVGKKSTYEKMPHKNATLNIPTRSIGNSLRQKLKSLLKLRIASLFKFTTFSAPPIIIVGSRMSGAEQLLSILSCHPNIHAIDILKLTHPTHHPLSPEADRAKNHVRLKVEKKHDVIDKKQLMLNLLRKSILFSAKRWATTSLLGVLAYERILVQFGNNVRIINVVRDGRDVILESDKKVLAKQVVSPERWVYDVQAGMELEAHPQALTVRHEDLVQDYEKTIQEICTFIGEADSAPLLSYPKGATMIEAGYWVGKWNQTQYSECVNNLLEIPDAVACLRHYGYVD